jgi:hypothetical protein
LRKAAQARAELIDESRARLGLVLSFVVHLIVAQS